MQASYQELVSGEKGLAFRIGLHVPSFVAWVRGGLNQPQRRKFQLGSITERPNWGKRTEPRIRLGLALFRTEKTDRPQHVSVKTVGIEKGRSKMGAAFFVFLQFTSHQFDSTRIGPESY